MAHLRISNAVSAFIECATKRLSNKATLGSLRRVLTGQVWCLSRNAADSPIESSACAVSTHDGAGETVKLESGLETSPHCGNFRNRSRRRGFGVNRDNGNLEPFQSDARRGQVNVSNFSFLLFVSGLPPPPPSTRPVRRRRGCQSAAVVDTLGRRTSGREDLRGRAQLPDVPTESQEVLGALSSGGPA